jgi:AraC family transcriptional regulator
MTDRSISASSPATAELQFGNYLPPRTDAIRALRGAFPQVSGGVRSMNDSDTYQLSTETPPECVPALATLIAGAVATFDADRNAARRYLMRASAILQAWAVHEPENGREARSRGGLAGWQLNRLVDYIEQHLAERITGEDLAGLIDVSIGQLFKAFKASVGIPPLQYVASRRLEFVCLLLRTSRESLSQIAVTAGFYDQSHLCRVFRRVLGVTPAAWRREMRRSPCRLRGWPKASRAGRRQRSPQSRGEIVRVDGGSRL